MRKSNNFMAFIVLFWCIYRLNSNLKCSFKDIIEKKHKNFSCGGFLLYFVHEVFIEVPLFNEISKIFPRWISTSNRWQITKDVSTGKHCVNSIFVEIVQKYFSEVTRSSIRENCGYTLKLAADRMEAGRAPLSSIKNVVDM